MRALALLAIAGVVLHAAVELRERDDWDVKLLGELLERTRNHTHLLLARAEFHARGVHKLQVVEDDNLHLVLAHETASLGAEFENREARSVVDKERRAVERRDACGELRPFGVGEATATNLLALEFAHITDKAVNELQLAHFEREHSHGSIVIHSHILSHGEHKRSFTHSGARGNNNEVARLPTRSDFVQIVVSGGKTAQTAVALGSDGDLIERLLDNGVDLRNIALDIALGNLEEFSLSLLEQVIDIVRLVESLALHHRTEGNQLTGKIFLRHNTRVILHVGSRSHTTCKLGNTGGAAHLVDSSVGAELLHHGEHIDGSLRHTESHDSLVDFLVFRLVEALGAQDVAHGDIGVALEHKSTEHSLLHLEVLRLHFPEFRHLGDINHLVLFGFI